MPQPLAPTLDRLVATLDRDAFRAALVERMFCAADDLRDVALAPLVSLAAATVPAVDLAPTRTAGVADPSPRAIVAPTDPRADPTLDAATATLFADALRRTARRARRLRTLFAVVLAVPFVQEFVGRFPVGGQFVRDLAHGRLVARRRGPPRKHVAAAGTARAARAARGRHAPTS